MKTSHQANMQLRTKTDHHTQRQSGFTLLEIMLVVGLIAILLAILIPSSVQARTRSYRQTCISNLRQINSAVQQWALECKQSPNAIPDETDITPYIKNNIMCPSGGTSFGDSYTLSTVSAYPICQKVPTTHALE